MHKHSHEACGRASAQPASGGKRHERRVTRLDAVKRMLGGRAIRDMGVLLGGAAGARVLQVLSVPVIARLFDPSDFGRISFLIALASTLNLFSSLAYEDAIVLPATERGARAVSRVAWSCLAASTLFIGLAAWQWPARLTPAWLGALSGWWLMLAAMVLLLGTSNILHGWALRRQRFGAIGASALAEAGVQAGGRILWGLLLVPGFAGLAVPYFAALGARAAALWPRAAAGGEAPARARSGSALPPPAGVSGAAPPGDTPAPGGRAHDEPVGLLATASRYAHFPLFGLPSSVIRAFTQRLPLLLLGALFAPAAAGLYAAANRLALMPSQAISQAGRKVVLQRLTGRRRRGARLLPVVATATAGLALLAAPPFLALALFGEPLLRVVLGDAWAGAGPYAQAIAPWGFTMLVVGPTRAVFQALERQRTLLGLAGVRLALFAVAAAFALRVRADDAVFTVALLGWAGAASNLLQVATGLLLAGRHDASRPSRAGGREALAS